MPVSADTLSLLMSKGLSGDDLIEVVRAIDGEMLRSIPVSGIDQQAERRRAADRDRKRVSAENLRNSAEAGAVRLPDKESSPTPPKEINPSQTLTPFGREQASADFNDFWKAYPKRKGSNPKQPAEKKFNLIVKRGTAPAEIIAGARKYAASVRNDEPQFTAMAITWLNRGGWKDDYADPPPRSGPASAKTGGFAALAKQMMRGEDERDHDESDGFASAPCGSGNLRHDQPLFDRTEGDQFSEVGHPSRASAFG